MKSSEEMINSLFERRANYAAEVKGHMISTKKISVIVAAIIFVFALSNGITYAANGEAWISSVWNHAFIHNPNSGKDDGDMYTFEGNGYSIQIQQLPKLDEEGKIVAWGAGTATQGVDIIIEDDNIILTFGDNRFDISDQIREKEYAFLKVSVSDRIMVCVVEQLTEKPKSEIIYTPGFYDYDFIKQTAGINVHCGAITLEEIESAPLYYAK